VRKSSRRRIGRTTQLAPSAAVPLDRGTEPLTPTWGWGLNPSGWPPEAFPRQCADSTTWRQAAILTGMVARIRTDGFVESCIPSLAHKPPSGPDWVHEIKHDGYRLIVRRDGAAVRLFTRRGHDWSDRYPAIAGAAAKLRAKSFTVDGEAVVVGADGVAIFDALHRRHKASNAILYAYDLLELDGEDLRPLPLSARKAALARLLARKPAGIVFNEHHRHQSVPGCGDLHVEGEETPASAPPSRALRIAGLSELSP
jgi:bifunctional non-homologous end joining protein LigD